jgi:hypothetical protein
VLVEDGFAHCIKNMDFSIDLGEVDFEDVIGGIRRYGQAEFEFLLAGKPDYFGISNDVLKSIGFMQK